MKFFKNPIKSLFSLFIIVICLSCFTINLQAINKDSDLDQQILLSLKANGILGFYAINTKTNQTMGYQANQRFPMCSTAKLMIVATILKKSMTDQKLLKQRLFYSQEELKKAAYAPITEKHLKDGMTIEALCAGAMMYSDNAAANLLMKTLGGPKVVTNFANSIGDHTFQLNRWEPKLNSALPLDNRDTSTPKAMAISLEKLILTNILAPKQKQLLKYWLINNTTGGKRIRQGITNHWLIGDKTGTGAYGTTNDIAIIWPPNHSPIIIAIYFKQKNKKAMANNHILVQTTEIIMHQFKQHDPSFK